MPSPCGGRRTWRWFNVLAALALTTTPSGAAVAAPPGQAAEFDGAVIIASAAVIEPELAAQILEFAHLRRAEFVVIPGAFEPGRPMTVRLPLGARSEVFELHPHSIRAATSAAFVQDDLGVHQIKLPTENTLRGTVVGVPGSVAAGGVMPGPFAGLYARIILDGDADYWIEPAPVARLQGAPGAPAGLHMIYTRDDLLAPGPDGGHCGNGESTRPNLAADAAAGEGGGGREGGHGRGATRYTVLLDIDTDTEFVDYWGGQLPAYNRIALVIASMNLQFERDVDIEHLLGQVFLRVAIDDPYVSFSSSTIIFTELAPEWNNAANHPGTSAMVQLFTGKALGGGTIGQAYAIGSICNDGASCSLVISDFNGLLMGSTDVSAHELGHLWSANHCACTNPPSTMHPQLLSINRFTYSVSPNNIAEIIAYRNTLSCLFTSTPGVAPANDACADAVQIGTGTFGYSNLNATNDGPAACGNFGSDIWFTYIAPCSGTATINTCDAIGYDSTLACYIGPCGTLTEFACNDDMAGACAANGFRSQITFPTIPGGLYRIRVGGFIGTQGEGVLNVSQSCTTPANDECAQATTIPAHCNTPTQMPFSTQLATQSAFTDPANCGFSSAGYGADAWFLYVAPVTCTVILDTCTGSGGFSAFDAVIAVYTSCPTANNQAIACNNNGPWSGCGGMAPYLVLNAVAGTAYYIRIGGFQGASGTGVLLVSPCGLYPNDTCATSFAVGVGSPAAVSTTRFACRHEDACQLGEASPDVFYSFTSQPLCGGTLTVTTCGAGTNYDTRLSLHSSCPATPSNEVACNDDFCGFSSSVTAVIPPNTTYYIRVAGCAASRGDFQLNTFYTPTPVPNNQCANASLLSEGVTVANIDCATSDNLQLFCNDTNPDVWYQFTAACNGSVTVDTCLGATFDTLLGIYTGPCNALTTVDCADNQCTAARSSSTFPVSAGVNYHVRLSTGTFGGTGTAMLRLAYVRPANDDCANAQVIVGSNTNASNQCASFQVNTPPVHCFGACPDVWFQYTALCTGTLTISTCTAFGFDTVLTAYTGSCGNLTEVACNDDALCSVNSLLSRLTIAASANTVYLIRLSGYGCAVGPALLSVSCVGNGNGFGACCMGSACVQTMSDLCTGPNTSFVDTPGASCDPPEPRTPCCRADFNRSGGISAQDVFDFLGAFFTTDPALHSQADFNGSGTVSSQDIFDFLAGFFWPTGCGP